MGPMTGRGFGMCRRQSAPNNVNQRFGPGYGRDIGFGFKGGGRQFSGPGLRRRYARPYFGFEPIAQDEKGYLEHEMKYLEDTLAGIKNRIHALEKSNDA
jgi:hypothetical protein